METEERNKQVYIDPAVHRKLTELAKADGRGLGTEVEYLINCEVIRRERGHDPILAAIDGKTLAASA